MSTMEEALRMEEEALRKMKEQQKMHGVSQASIHNTSIQSKSKQSSKSTDDLKSPNDGDLITFCDNSFDASQSLNASSFKFFESVKINSEEPKKSNSWNDLLKLIPENTNKPITNISPKPPNQISFQYFNTSPNPPPQQQHQYFINYPTATGMNVVHPSNNLSVFRNAIGPVHRSSSSPHMLSSLDTNQSYSVQQSTLSLHPHSTSLKTEQYKSNVQSSVTAWKVNQSNDNFTSTTFDFTSSKHETDKDQKHLEIDNVFERWLTDSQRNEDKLSTATTPENQPIDFAEWDPLGQTKSNVGFDDAFIPEDSTSAPTSPVRTNSSKPIRFSNSFVQNELVTNSSSKNEYYKRTSSEQFLHSVLDILHTHPVDNASSNRGYLISPMMPKWQISNNDREHTIKIKIITKNLSEPVVFSCTESAAVEHVLSQALCIAYEDINSVQDQEFVFKVAGRIEYLSNESTLGMYEYVQDCKKFDCDVQLELIKRNELNLAFKREESDMNEENIKCNVEEIFGNLFPVKLTRGNIEILMERFYTESEKLIQEIESGSVVQMEQQCDRLQQTVKACCSVMCGVETRDLHNAMETLRNIVRQPKNQLHAKLSGDKDTMPLSSSSTYSVVSKTFLLSRDAQNVGASLEKLASEVLYIVETMSKSVEIDSFSTDVSNSSSNDVLLSSSSIKDLFSFNIVSMHRIPHLWAGMYEEYFTTCSLYHGDKELYRPVRSLNAKIDHSFNIRIFWNKWLIFPVKICDLPRETRLNIVLHGTAIPSEGKTSSDKPPKALAWVNVPIFKHNRVLRQASEFVGMWMFKGKKRTKTHRGTNSSNLLNPESIVLHVQLVKEVEKDKIVFPHFSIPQDKMYKNRNDLTEIDEITDRNLKQLLAKNPFNKFTEKERKLLWKYRHSKSCMKKQRHLPRLLQCVESWSPSNLDDVYDYVALWQPLKPLEAIQLLSLGFPDTVIRELAISWINNSRDDELHDCLVQLTQALKLELYHDNQLAKFLLERAMESVRVALRFYWLLHENSTSSSSARLKLYLETLKLICGGKLRKEFDKESYVTKMISRSAEAVKLAKESTRMSILTNELDKVATRVNNRSFRLPTNPSFSANSIDVANCSYFTSNAIPLKVVFKSFEMFGGLPADMKLMYKVGDDLRQDVLTMQLVSLMDKMWLSEGLDLRMITFECLAVGEDRGWVELIPNSRTLREIQAKYGLTGAFKDRPIAEWLQMHNPTGISYSKAEENFMLSCAGYCVATYILGICDRHNDNIMLRQSGHIFHIDFAKFLGHAQMFGNIKRDRTPFVLTSDMAYVINGGDRKSSRFHDFIDICCSAFNIIRKNAQVIINVLSLMLDSGIPELNSDVDLKYVYDALKPEASDTEATTMFTRLIETSLSSSFTRLNFFIHNLAQLRFSGSDSDKNSLSFASKTRSAATDGLITDANVVAYQKRYNPEKYYIFCVRLKRERRAAESYVFRTYEEFQELHEKLAMNFHHHQLPPFPAKVIVGRSQIKQVADRRKVQLNTYLDQLLRGTLAVSQCDLIYTFFQPLLRDEQDNSANMVRSPQKTTATARHGYGGEIKMSIHHKNEALFIMIMHCRNLVSSDGADPDPYVKTYLRPDTAHNTKRKTKVARKTLHPTFNEMLVYPTSLSNIRMKTLHVSVWNYEQFHENDFLGSVLLPLDTIDLTKDTTEWFQLMTA